MLYNFIPLPEDYTASDVTFFYKSIGREQSIYINGKEVARNIKEGEAARALH